MGATGVAAQSRRGRRPPRPRAMRRPAPARDRIAAVAGAPVRPAAATDAGEYVVRAGDTLSAIAVRLGRSWPALWALNRDRVADPDLIYTGQRLRI